MYRDVPDVNEIRYRIETIENPHHRICLKYLFLIDGRVSEGIGRVTPGDEGGKVYGPYPNDVEIQRYIKDEYDEEAVVFHVRTAKRGGMIRYCAVPSSSEYEPWALEVYDHFNSMDQYERVFPFTRQKIWAISRKAFDGLKYSIEKYAKVLEEVKVYVPKHERNFATHGIRHVRATQLVMKHGFDGMDLSLFGGWTLRTMLGVSSSVGRYARMNWRLYFKKLLLPIA